MNPGNRAADPGPRIPDPGQRIPGTARRHVISPIDGSVYTAFELPSAADIEATIDRAVRAQDAWKHVPLAERSAICRRMTDLMVERADAIGTELTWQIGRPVVQSPFEIRRGVQERARYMIA